MNRENYIKIETSHLLIDVAEGQDDRLQIWHCQPEVFKVVAKEIRLSSFHRHLEGSFGFEDIRSIIQELKLDFQNSTLEQIKSFMNPEKNDASFSSFLNKLSTRWIMRIIQQAILETNQKQFNDLAERAKATVETYQKVLTVIFDHFFRICQEDNLSHVSILFSPLAYCRTGDLDPKAAQKARPPLPGIEQEAEIADQWQKHWKATYQKAIKASEDPAKENQLRDWALKLLGPSLEEIMRILKKTADQYQNLEIEIWPCLRREQRTEKAKLNLDQGRNPQTIAEYTLAENLLKAYKQGWIDGFDIGGFELVQDLSIFNLIFNKLRKTDLKMPLTVHILETNAENGASVIKRGDWGLIMDFKPERLGHATHLFRPAAKDQLESWIKTNRSKTSKQQPPIYVTFSPTSNKMTGAHSEIFRHPIFEFIKGNHPLFDQLTLDERQELIKEVWSCILIGADDPEAFGTTATDETFLILQLISPYVYPDILNWASSQREQARKILEQEKIKARQASQNLTIVSQTVDHQPPQPEL